jgi:hypothetical protein
VAVDAAAIMLMKRLARGSSGMAAPVNHVILPWPSMAGEPAALPA